MAATFTSLLADEATPTTWTLKSAPSGNQPAVFMNTAFGDTPRTSPTLKVSARAQQNSTGRKVRMEFVFPHVAIVDGVYKVQSKMFGTLDVTLPDNIPDSNAANFVHLMVHAMHDAQFTSAMKTGYYA